MTRKYALYYLITGVFMLWFIAWFAASRAGVPLPDNLVMVFAPWAIIIGIALISNATRRP